MNGNSFQSKSTITQHIVCTNETQFHQYILKSTSPLFLQIGFPDPQPPYDPIRFLGESFGQLFDLAQDPGETRNLWDVPSAEAKKHELIKVLLEWHVRSQYHTPDWPEEWR